MKTYKQVLIGASASVALGLYGATRYFFNVAFERKTLEKFPRLGKGSPWEEEIEEGRIWLKCHAVPVGTINSFDGLKLSGYYVEAPNAKRTIVMCHGWRGSWERDLAGISKWFYKNGCNMLLIDQRAHGFSQGKYTTYGLFERLDCVSWCNWLNKMYRPEKIFLYGVSMGASTVLMASGTDGLPINVAGIIADCGFSSPYDIIAYTGWNIAHVPEHPFMDVLNLMVRRRIGVGLKSFSVADAMKNNTTPLLLIHGKEDEFVPFGMSIENYNESNQDTSLLLIDGANHCLSYYVDRKNYTKTLKEFIIKAEKDFKTRDLYGN